jgi:lipoprotein-anchoring transpeptidase ErfK/SrfK
VRRLNAWSRKGRAEPFSRPRHKLVETDPKQKRASSEIGLKRTDPIRAHRFEAGATGKKQRGIVMHTAISAKLINITAAALTGAALLFGAGNAAHANQIVAKVSLSQQIMEVTVDGRPTYTWKVSTGDRRHITPTGSFKPTRMHEMWYSKKYDNAPMPHSVFFSGGYAVHATYAISRLGRPASHGCVRLHPDAAADFYQLVEAFGPGNTSILIVK